MSDFLFEWNKEKNKYNIEKHGINFVEAKTVFEDENMIYINDDEHSTYEERFLVIGMSRFPRLLVVCHCVRDGLFVRIISARKATQKERAEYENER